MDTLGERELPEGEERVRERKERGVGGVCKKKGKSSRGCDQRDKRMKRPLTKRIIEKGLAHSEFCMRCKSESVCSTERIGSIIVITRKLFLRV